MAEELNTDTTTEAPAETSLHDDVAEAFDQVETRDAPTAPSNGAAAPPGAEAPPPLTGERVRGPDGRFTPAKDAPKAAPAAPGQPEAAPAGKQALAAPQKPLDAPKAAPDQPAAAAPQQLRAPTSWKPGAREHWAKLPPEVQQEVARREGEVQRTLHESARSREALTHVQGVLSPYAQNIAATGQDALAVMSSLFSADNTLRHGSIAEKAQLTAGLIKSYGVDIGALDAALAGQPAESDPNSMLAEKLRREMQAQLQPVLGYFNKMQGQRQQAVQQINTQSASEVESFATDGAHEFFEDVRADMADIMDMMAARGVSMSLQDAYERAIRINPQVSDIVAKRAEAERVSAAAGAAQRARRTAASIGGSPAPAGAAPGSAGDSRRAEIEAAWDAASNS